MNLFNGPGLAALRRSLIFTWLLVMGLALIGSMGGCGTSNPYPPGSYDRAVFLMENGKRLEAVTALESFVRRNPTDSLAAEAQFQKAMLYLDMKEYPLAAVEFQILRKDYPTSDRVEDSSFYEGVAYFRQVGKVQRDITGALEARGHLIKFSQDYPNSKHTTEVREYLLKISDLVVRKRLQQAKVFWQLGRYEAVKMTLTTALEEESSSALLDRVLWQLGRACQKLEQDDEAASMYQRLLDSYPDSEYRDRAASARKALIEGPEPPEDAES